CHPGQRRAGRVPHNAPVGTRPAPVLPARWAHERSARRDSRSPFGGAFGRRRQSRAGCAVAQLRSFGGQRRRRALRKSVDGGQAGAVELPAVAVMPRAARWLLVWCLTIGSGVALATPDPFIGTWVLDRSQSRYESSTPPEQMVIVMTRVAGGIHYRSETR